MKKIIPLLACILTICVSCNETTSELTGEQKAVIVSEVEGEFVELISNLSLLDMEIWSRPWSEDNFISVNSGNNYFTTLDEFKDSVSFYFSNRESQEVQIVNQHITVLNSDLALLSSITNWNILFRNGERYLFDKVMGTLLWKKEEGGWKVIYLHESWQAQ
jgi:hypothetical protein